MMIHFTFLDILHLNERESQSMRVEGIFQELFHSYSIFPYQYQTLS